MDEHTPGPWKAEKRYDGKFRITGNSQYIVEPCKMDEANARLIATAPDLLEEIEGLLDSYWNVVSIHVYDTENGERIGPVEQAYIDGIRALIARAKGTT